MTTGLTGRDSASGGQRESRTQPILRSSIIVGATVLALILGVAIGVIIGRASSGSPVAGTAAGSPPAVCPATTVAAAGLPSVVTISAQAAAGGPGGTGSGEIIRAGGYVLTNDHVISVAANGGSVAVRYTDGRSAAATIVGRDVLTDLAVFKADDAASGLPVIGTGSSTDLVVGEPVVALGAPLGLVDTVTAGIVSAMDREVALPAEAGQTATWWARSRPMPPSIPATAAVPW